MKPLIEERRNALADCQRRDGPQELGIGLQRDATDLIGRVARDSGKCARGSDPKDPPLCGRGGPPIWIWGRPKHAEIMVHAQLASALERFRRPRSGGSRIGL